MSNKSFPYTINTPFADVKAEVKKVGTLAEFVFALACMASQNAPNTIKSTFGKPIVLPKAENGDTLYFLSKGVFNGKHYSCFATSGNKYLKDNYVIQISDEAYDMYQLKESA